MRLQLNSTNRYIGKVEVTAGVPYYVVHREQSHFFKKYNGFGFNEAKVLELIGRGVKLARLFYHGSVTRVYLVSLTTIRDKGFRYQSLGFEPQLVLGRSFMGEVE